jgi:hypothetical protein
VRGDFSSFTVVPPLVNKLSIGNRRPLDRSTIDAVRAMMPPQMENNATLVAYEAALAAAAAATAAARAKAAAARHH